MIEQKKYQPTTKAAAFLDKNVPDEMQGFYSAEELRALVALRGTERDVESRMPVKITRHYFELAKKSLPSQTLVKASPKETYDLEGAPDPVQCSEF